MTLAYGLQYTVSGELETPMDAIEWKTHFDCDFFAFVAIVTTYNSNKYKRYERK